MRVMFLRWLSHYMALPEWCDDYGVFITSWHASDELWYSVTGSANGLCLCLRCFARRASEKGIVLIVDELKG